MTQFLFIIGKHFPGIIHSNNSNENGHDQRGNGGRQAGGELHRQFEIGQEIGGLLLIGEVGHQVENE